MSHIAACNAIVMGNNAAYGAMQSRQAMMGLANSANPYNPNFEALHRQDTRLALDIANYNMQYQMATAMREQADAMAKKDAELQKKVNYFG